MKSRRDLWILMALIAMLLLVPSAVPTTAHAQRPSFNPRLNTLRRPTVSPYLELLNSRNNLNVGVPTYQTRVRPRLEQRQVNRQQQAQIQRLQSDVARQGTARRAGTDELRGTGHQSFFMNYSHFFPSLRPPR